MGMIAIWITYRGRQQICINCEFFFIIIIVVKNQQIGLILISKLFIIVISECFIKLLIFV